jgi:hypothetical protein
MAEKSQIQAVDEYEAGKIMDRGVQTLRNDRHLGRGCPYVKIGRSVRYLMHDIREYLLKNRIDPEGKI